MIDKLFIDKVKSALNIVNVVETFTNLQKAGINFKGICPFHNDSHPSMVVSPAKQTYHCFVCGAGGDVIEFVKEHLNLTFPEALRWCAKNNDIGFVRPTSSRWKRRPNSIESTCRTRQNFF